MNVLSLFDGLNGLDLLVFFGLPAFLIYLAILQTRKERKWKRRNKIKIYQNNNLI
tara:strand:+ start:1891 stop:2055 length:165 start_codon:yes stop_codon:yes gene_type:complete